MMRPAAREIAGRVNAGERTAEAVAQETLARIVDYDAVQPEVWIERPTAQTVLERARIIDRRIAAGETLPLAGVPYAVKDNIDVAGLPTTAGCPAFTTRPAVSASVISRLDAAGALMMGKTNLDQFATGLVGVRSPYGVPRCVYNREYISGGSSSGSAVATAAGLVAFALGTDTAGSGRVPAALNGLIGFKPTKGRWSVQGLTPACRTLDCISVFTDQAKDAELVDRVLTAFDPDDPYSRHAPDVAAVLPATFRFGVPSPAQLQFFGDSQSQILFEAAVERLKRLGGESMPIDIDPLLSCAKLLYSGPWLAERAAAIEPLLRDHPAALHPTVREIIRGGLNVSGIETFRGLYALQGFVRQAQAMWSSIDVLVLPTTPTTYRVAEVQAEPLALNSNLGLYTNFVNLLDMSAVAVPAGWRANATGFGVSLIGPAWSDAALLDLANRYQAAEPAIVAPPMDLQGVAKTVSIGA